MKNINLIVIIVVLFTLFTGLAFYKSAKNETEVSITKDSKQNELRMDLLAYMPYSEDLLAQTKQKGNTLLFFSATKWCTSCSDLDREIKANIEKLPTDLTILEVDYDNDVKTNRKYNITIQHTLVLLDKNGNEIKRWVGGDLNYLLSKVFI